MHTETLYFKVEDGSRELVYFAELARPWEELHVDRVKCVGVCCSENRVGNGWESDTNVPSLDAPIDYAVAHLVVNGVIPKQLRPFIEQNRMNYLMEYIEKAH